MAQLTIIVEFETHDGCADQLLALLRDHALLTLQEEVGCLRFDVVRPLGEDGGLLPDRILVDALFSSEAALAAHERDLRQSEFQAAAAPLLRSRRRLTGRVEGPVQEGLTPDQLNASND